MSLSISALASRLIAILLGYGTAWALMCALGMNAWPPNHRDALTVVALTIGSLIAWPPRSRKPTPAP